MINLYYRLKSLRSQVDKMSTDKQKLFEAYIQKRLTKSMDEYEKDLAVQVQSLSIRNALNVIDKMNRI